MTYFFWLVVRQIIKASFVMLGIAFIGVLYYMEFQLPDISALNTVQLQVPLHIFTQDGKLISEYGEKRRIPVPYSQIPKSLINAVLATEDQRFFQHPGIDIPGLFRAGIQLALTGKKVQGGSTITMQVARSFYLSRNKTFGRKLREILLALKIENQLSKEKILELYLNKIFLGYRAYGVAAAADVYYGKPLNELSIDQIAMLAGLPKAPSSINPLANPEAAKKRRDHVLGRMRELDYIDEKTYETAINTPLNAKFHELQSQVKAPYVAELARKQLEEMYGDSIYTEGFNVYTTIDSRLQENANKAVHDGLLDYDQRHGYRGAEDNLGKPTTANRQEWQTRLNNLPGTNELEAAAVIALNTQTVTVLRGDGSLVSIPWEGLVWARRQIDENDLGRTPSKTSDILKLGDVIRIMPTDIGWRLAQIPKAEAGLVSLDSHTGKVLALVGGFDFQTSKFNRITTAQRQPGSSFKPFIYSAALEKGYTLASLFNDAPIVVENPSDNSLWRPQNDNRQFNGPTRMREALIHSRNLVSIRLLDLTGIPYTIDYLQQFGFSAKQLPTTLSLALGTASVNPLQMATGYAVFANGGYRVTPYFLDSINDSHGLSIYQAKSLTACGDQCSVSEEAAPRAISPQNAFLVTSALHDVIQHGTATLARSIERNDLAGKTGTTQNQVDAWFAGYNKDFVTVAWMGFDQPRSLHESGGQAALPLWIAFMQATLKGRPDHPIEQPDGIVSIKIDVATGARAAANDPKAIFEYFSPPNLPADEKPVAAQNNSTGDTQDAESIY